MVTRYNLIVHGTGDFDMEERGKGQYVTYKDYEALEVKYFNLCQVVEETQRALNMALPDDEDC